MEGDSVACVNLAVIFYFNPLPPHGGRPHAFPSLALDLIFQSTPSAWRETPQSCRYRCFLVYFNPLPPHGGRPKNVYCIWQETSISIHSLRMEGDIKLSFDAVKLIDFNPLPPHGGRRTVGRFCRRRKRISIHSLRMEGDSRYSDTLSISVEFQSTPSAWRETFW